MTDVATTVELLRETAVGVVGAGLLAAVGSVLVAAGYRWTTTRSPPAGVGMLVGLSPVAGYLTAVAIRSGEVVAGVPLDHQASAGYLVGTFLVAGTTAAVGGRLGDRIARQVTGLPHIDASGEAGAAVRSARLAADLELPDRIDDADGYRPVDPAVRRALSGASIRLPHGTSTAERRHRIERHLEGDYGVGYAEVTMADDGTVERVVVGRRSSGLGSMLPPATVGVAIRADPAPNASLGDPVEIRSAADRSRLVATGTVRSTNGSVATVLVDADHAGDLVASERYRLVTRPEAPTDGYEFASAVRSADETVTTLTVDPDGPLAGEFVGWLPGRALVLDRDGELVSLPDDNETLEAGDSIWVLASPADLRHLESVVDATAGPT